MDHTNMILRLWCLLLCMAWVGPPVQAQPTTQLTATWEAKQLHVSWVSDRFVCLYTQPPGEPTAYTALISQDTCGMQGDVVLTTNVLPGGRVVLWAGAYPWATTPIPWPHRMMLPLLQKETP